MPIFWLLEGPPPKYIPVFVPHVCMYVRLYQDSQNGGKSKIQENSDLSSDAGINPNLNPNSP